MLPVELLNGITFALAYSAMISYAALLAPPGAEGTLQGITGMVLFGIGMKYRKKITNTFFLDYECSEESNWFYKDM